MPTNIMSTSSHCQLNLTKKIPRTGKLYTQVFVGVFLMQLQLVNTRWALILYTGDGSQVVTNLLMNIAANVDLSNGVIVEFGTYFGKSTACLINGILANPSFTNERIYLYSYDSFEATIGHGFEEYVLKHAKSIKLENALNRYKCSFNFDSDMRFAYSCDQSFCAEIPNEKKKNVRIKKEKFFIQYKFY
jgi:hypothetical protein